MKKVLFAILLLLAVASLGLALPQPAVPSPPMSASPSPPKPTSKPQPGTSPAPPTALSALPAAFASPEAVADELKVSPKCAAAILTIFTDPEIVKCIPISAFLPLLPIVTDPDFLKKLKEDPAGTFKKIEPAFVEFSNAFCAAPVCSKDGISKAIQSLSTDCADELKDNAVIKLAFAFLVFYQPVHDITCFKSKQPDKLFCWDESLKTIFSLPKSPIKITGDQLTDSIAVADPPVICTVCNKDIINTFFNFLNNNDLAKQVLAGLGVTDDTINKMKIGVAVKCGISFEDGKIPG